LPNTRLGKATLAYAWLSIIILAALITFLSTWAFLHRNVQIKTSIFRSNIKEYLFDGFISLPTVDTGMSTISPSTPDMTQAPEAATPAIQPSAASRLRNSLVFDASYLLEKEVERSLHTHPVAPA
jgi:hypothetical protein